VAEEALSLVLVVELTGREDKELSSIKNCWEAKYEAEIAYPKRKLEANSMPELVQPTLMNPVHFCPCFASILPTLIASGIVLNRLLSARRSPLNRLVQR